jgi:hypothetical protein
MVRKRNIALLISLIVLIGLTVFVGMYEPGKPEIRENARLFALADTAAIEKVVISGPDFKNELMRSPNGWLLNGEHVVDPNLSKVMLAVFNRVRVTRPVSKVEQEPTKERIVKDGVKVEVYGKGEKLRSFFSGGNTTQTESYFMEEGGEEVYVVTLPGYKSFVSGLFTMRENDWRDRTVFASRWQEIQQVSLNYPHHPEQSFSIMFKDRFFEVTGVASVDTAAMMSYLEIFAYVPADRLIAPGENSQYDSLKQTQPWLVLELKSIASTQDNTLAIFPKLKGDNSFLGVDKNNQMMLFHSKKVQALSRKKSDFVRKE